MPEINKRQFHSFFYRSPTVHPKGSQQSQDCGLQPTAVDWAFFFVNSFGSFLMFFSFLPKDGAKVVVFMTPLKVILTPNMTSCDLFDSKCILET